MTRSQLRAYAAVVRLGSVKAAAHELGVTDAAVSGQVAALRKELGDALFERSGSGLAFTPGGLRLATRAVELLGLQDRTIREVGEARGGRRLLRLAASSLFAEFSAPGLIQLFTARADDIDIELSHASTDSLTGLVTSRAVDIAIGPRSATVTEGMEETVFLKYQLVLVVGTSNVLAASTPNPDRLKEHMWLLGPSAADGRSLARRMLRAYGVPESKQRIFQSHAAALDETRRGTGIGVAVSFAVAEDVAQGRLREVSVRGARQEGVWSARALAKHAQLPVARELLHFLSTPRATQAMLHGASAAVGRFRPAVYVTLWS